MSTKRLNLLKLSLLLFTSLIFFYGCKDEFLNPAPLVPGVNADTAVPPGTPNIILIMGDDVGYEIPAYTGGESYSTPNIDRLASMGMQFTRCYASPLCSPSRFALLTGKYNFRNYADTSWGSMNINEYTIGNMMRDAGYSTCVAGKWQLNGGAASITALGFDRHSVTAASKINLSGTDDESGEDVYKNPKILQDGVNLDSSLLGKYGEDVNLDFMFNYMDSVKDKPFFVYWAPNLCHKPFSPTPDNVEFQSWDPYKHDDADSVFYPSMVKYYDKEVGRLLDKLQSSSYGKNTIVIYIGGDNGTVNEIHSRFKGQVIEGGKGKYYEYGIHVPMIVYWPGAVTGGSVSNNMIDLVDFLPTIAAMSNNSVPSSHGTIDGISFIPELFGFTQGGNLRQYSFNWYNPDQHGPDQSPTRIWAMDSAYKQYDSVKGNGLYHYSVDPYEELIIKGPDKTDSEKLIANKLQSVIDKYKAEAH